MRELLRAPFELAEQTCVLHSDNRLIRERLQESDLPLGKEAGLCTSKKDRPDDVAFEEHRNGETAPIIRILRDVPRLVARVSENVGFMDYARRSHGPGTDRVGRELDGIGARDGLHAARAHAMHSGKLQHVLVDPRHHAQIGVAQLNGALGNRVEHRAGIRG